MKKTLLALVLGLATALSFAAVDVNKATEADLDSIKGIGPGTSSKILQERQPWNGPCRHRRCRTG